MKLLAVWFNMYACLHFVWISPTTGNAPSIDGCQYIDADSVECWWTRSQHDNSTNYRLSYFRERDPHHQRLRRICQPTREHTYFKSTKQYCTINDATPFARYNFSIAILCKDCENASCICGQGSFYLFECDPTNVLLQAPPGELKLERPHNQLTWLPPNKPNSMLSYVRKRMIVEYKVQYKVSTTLNLDNVSSEWQVWFIGNATSFHVPTLIPGTQYTARVLARFIPLYGPDFQIWSSPSNVVTFQVNVPVVSTSEPTTAITFGNKSSFSTQPLSAGFSEPTLSTTITVAASAACVLLVLFFVALYRLMGCPKKKNLPKPVVMVEMDSFDGNISGMYGSYEISNEEAEILLSPSRPGNPTPQDTFHKCRKFGLAESVKSQAEHERLHTGNNIWKVANLKEDDIWVPNKTNADESNALNSPEKMYSDQSVQNKSAIRTILVPTTQKSTSQYDFSAETQFSKRANSTTGNNSFYSTDMDYVMSTVTSPEIDYVSSGNECSCSNWSKNRSSCGSTEMLPDYVKQAKNNQHIELFLAITSETVDCNDQVKYKGYHYCSCRKVLMKAGTTLENVMEAICPACRMIFEMKKTIRKCNGTMEDASHQQLSLPRNSNENRRSSTSDNSVDSGYSPDSPMTP